VVTSTGLRPRASSRAPIGREGILRKVTLFGGGGDPLQKRILTHGAYLLSGSTIRNISAGVMNGSLVRITSTSSKSIPQGRLARADCVTGWSCAVILNVLSRSS
jgi:hypothetical protein